MFKAVCDNLDDQKFHLFCDKIRELRGTAIDRPPVKT